MPGREVADWALETLFFRWIFGYCVLLSVFLRFRTFWQEAVIERALEKLVRIEIQISKSDFVVRFRNLGFV